MSYRSFTHLLGETSLERKCRFLFGAATLVLIAGSFWWYAWKTESVAYDQMETIGRMLVRKSLMELHLEKWDRERAEWTPEQKALFAEFAQRTEGFDQWIPNDLKAESEIVTAKSDDSGLRQTYEQMAANGEWENGIHLSGQNRYLFRALISARESCIRCHQKFESDTDLAVGRPMGMASIKISTEPIDNHIHFNRAILITTALVTSLLLMGGSYIIVRYVIVKPVKHLKDVSDAISSGNLNIRSEIQTGDEFEDLSYAFNRMLRTLVSVQDQLKDVNHHLDAKVDELAQANMALYESNQLKSDFLATMSHELRTPLNSILGFSEVLLSNDSTNDKQKRWVMNIQSSGDRLLSLINDILDLAKMESGKMQMRIEEFSIHDVAEGLLNMFRPLADKKNIELTTQVEPGVPVLKQDPDKLQQILWNLLSNAIKFTPEGGRVMLHAESDGLHLLLTVSDTGVGIALEDQEIIFEKFRQTGSALTREQPGTGLGLSIVRELAKLLGGNISLQSELGRGSTFTVTIPVSFNQRRQEPIITQPITSSPAAEIAAVSAQ